MISNSDLEKAWFLYKTEYKPHDFSFFHRGGKLVQRKGKGGHRD